jgi:hypothetical protein
MTGAMFKLTPESVYVDLVPGNEEEMVVIEPPEQQAKVEEEKTKSKEPKTNFNHK